MDVDKLRVYGRAWSRRAAGVLAVPMAIAVCWVGPSAQAPRQFYASPSGVPSNDGSITRPIDLDTAISSLGPVRPGDTVWLRGGTYRRQPGPGYNGVTALYVSTLRGTAAAPIFVRQYPGERATLDGNLGPSRPVLVVDGDYTVYAGFEITNSHTESLVGAWLRDRHLRAPQPLHQPGHPRHRSGRGLLGDEPGGRLGECTDR